LSLTDQASNLRSLVKGSRLDLLNRKSHIIAVTSGKGGVGKSFLALHLAHALASAAANVLIVDANLKNPALHTLTNCDPVYPIHYWLTENLAVNEKALIHLNQNIDLLGNNNTFDFKNSFLQENGHIFLELLKPLALKYVYIILDLETGLNQWNLSLLSEADLCLLVTITDPTSVIDTYMMLKATHSYFSSSKYGLIVNQILKQENGVEAHKNLNLALNHFLNFQIELLSLIPFEMDVRKSVREQKTLWEINPNSKVIRFIRDLASLIPSKLVQKNTKKIKEYEEVIQ
jgi:flagellar biosynthesis protein FlhG